MGTGSASQFAAGANVNRWRTLDIVVTAVIGVVFGVVFWFWDIYVWAWTGPLFQGFQPAQYIISGVWLMPAVLAPLVVRKPGAALFAELVAAILSALIGNQWGLDVILSGFVQGAAAELIFAFGLYRSWGLMTALLAGGAAALGEAMHDLPIYFPSDKFGLGFQASIAVIDVVSGVLIAGFVSYVLLGTIRRAGVLESFPLAT